MDKLHDIRNLVSAISDRVEFIDKNKDHSFTQKYLDDMRKELFPKLFKLIDGGMA